MIIHYYDILFNNAKLKLKSKYIKTLNNVKLYNFKTFISDLLAGLTISSVIVPQAIAYSSLARISPISALMTAVFPVMIYSIFGSSLHLSVGPEAFTSILFGMTITSQTTLGHDAINTASWLTILIGTFCLILSILRAGYLENILTGYLLIGFITGIALLVMVEQLPNLLGLDIKFGNVSLSEKMSLVFSKTAATKNLTLLLGLSNILFLISIQQYKKYLGKKKEIKNLILRYFKNIPEVLILVIIMIGVSYAADLNMKGVKILGFFDSSLPSPSVPQFDKKLIEGLIEPAIIIAVTGFIESQSVTRTFGYKKGYFPDHNSELFALGFSNVIGAFLGCYASFGSLPRSRILFNNGGKTTVASFLSAVFVLIITLCLSEILKFLPKTTLAAIVFVAAFNLIEWGKLINICKHKSYGEIWMVLATFIINLLVNIQSAILLSLITGAIYIIKNSTVVDISLKGRIEDSLVVKFSDEDKDSSSRELQLKNRTSIVNSSKMSKNSVAPTVTKELAETTSKNENETVDKEDINGKQIYNKINKKKSYIYVNMDEYPEAEILGNFTICSINVPLLFYNCCKLRVEIERSRKRQARYFQKDTQYTENNTILLDFQNSKAIDGAAVSILKGLIRSYKLNKVKVYFSGLNKMHNRNFKKGGLHKIIDFEKEIFKNITDAVQKFEERNLNLS